MKIFGIGLSRTGTTSLAHLLKDVGINIVHYPNKQQLFAHGNDGACDIPAAAYYKELDKKFPNSKFIYTVRNQKDWLESVDKYLGRKTKRVIGSWQKQNRIAMYGQMEFNRDIFASKYDEHNNDIHEYFKGREQDLLILDIIGGDNIEKLLAFLNIKIVRIPTAI